MKFLTFLFAIIFILLSDMQAEPLQLPVLRRLGLRRLTPYRTLLGLRPIYKCNRNILLQICPISSLYHAFILNNDSPQNSVPLVSFDPNTSLPTRRILDGDFANIDLETPARLSSSVNDFEIEKLFKLDLKLDKSKLRPVYYHEVGSLPELVTELTTAEEIVPVIYETTREADSVINETTNEADSVINETTNEADSIINETTKIADSVINEITKEVDSVINPTTTVIVTNQTTETIEYNLFNQNNVNKKITFAFDLFERNLYVTNYNKFLALMPASKGSSGMSFVQSGLFLQMSLMALSTEVDVDTKNEIDTNFGVGVSDVVTLIKETVDSLPNCTEALKFLWSSRLVLRPGRQVSEEFRTRAAIALHLKISHFEGSEGPEAMAKVLNKLIEQDSEGAIRDTFEEEDLSDEVEAVFITTLYFRARWRSAPTLLNGTWLFRDSADAPSRSVRMIRINDVMKYVDLPEWDAEVVEISYMTQGLSLLIFMPRKHSLKHLVENLTSSNLNNITDKMQTIRIAATLPLYTLRMTLLLPNKLQAMGMSRIVDASEAEGPLRLSHAVQRIMFWAEAGRNAFKDDGLEWDEPPEFEIVVDRPYIFFVRWQDLTLMNGNFVL